VKKIVSGLTLFLLAFAAATVFQRLSSRPSPSPLVQFGEQHTLHSKILNENRPYWVYLPKSYQSGQKYPVLYILDGDWNFSWSSQVVQYMSDSLEIPELIVVAVPNIDRDKDFTPTHDTNYVTSGGGPEFEKFLNEELTPEINAKFRTVPYRILAGHSLGGLLAGDVFLGQMDDFQACIAIDPSFWWDNNFLVQRAKEFSPKPDSHAAIFITTAGWRSLDPTNSMTLSQNLFVSILRTNLSSGMRSGYKVESEDHVSARLISLYDGLRFIFEGYKPMDPLVLNSPMLIDQHFKQLSNRLGFQIAPPAALVSAIGSGLLYEHETNNAVECLKWNIKNHPALAYTYSDLADAYAAEGEKALAIQNYNKALQLNPNAYGVKDALKKLR
jgi:uncharacterized protein